MGLGQLLTAYGLGHVCHIEELGGVFELGTKIRYYKISKN